MRCLSIPLFLFTFLILGAPVTLPGQGFTFQGHLRSAGQPVTDEVDLTFELFDDPDAGGQIGATVDLEDVDVSNGLFSVVLDFGPGAFSDGPRWVRISVDGSPLSPRQPVTPSPQAIHAASVSHVGDAALSGIYTGELNFTNPDNQFTGVFSGDGAGLTGLDAGNIASGVLPEDRLPLSVLEKLPSEGFLLGLQGSFETPFTPRAVTVSGIYAYVSMTDGFFMFDVSDKNNPMPIDSLPLTSPNAAAVSGNRLYVVSDVPGNVLQIFDVTEPNNAQILGFINTDSRSFSVAVSGDHVFVANSSTDLLQIFDASDPFNIALAGSIATGNTPLSVALSGSHAYVTNSGDDTLTVYDVSDPANPSLAGSVGTGDSPRSVVVSGNHAYVVTRLSNALEVYDIGDPGSPFLVGSAATGVQPNSVAVSGSRVYVVNLASGNLQAFDVSDPTNPTLLESIATAGNPFGVAASGSHVYTVASPNAFEIFSTEKLLFNQLVASTVGFVGSGAGLTDLSADNITTGTLPSGRLSGTYSNALTLSNAGNSFTGNGAGLTNLNAASITTGTLPSARLSGTYSNSLTFANSGNSFTGSGAGLTNINASNITSGNLNIARLPAGGNWSLSSLLNIASNTLVVNPSNNRVGIAISTPDSRLHVAGGSTATLTTGSGFFQVGPTNGANLVMDGGRILARSNGQTGLMRINTTGLRVGSGADPFGTLHVEATGGGVEGVGFRVRFDAATKVRVTSNGGTSLGSNNDAPTNGLRVAGQSVFVGNVGVATTNTSGFTLAVNGTAAKIGGGSWSSFSDERLKHDIQPLAAGVLDRVLSLNGYTFQYHDEAVEKKLAMAGTQTGLLAQEVAEVFPDWVEADDEGYLFVTERGTTALFVEAMRELRMEKDAEIAALRAEKEDLARRLERMETFFLVAERQ